MSNSLSEKSSPQYIELQGLKLQIMQKRDSKKMATTSSQFSKKIEKDTPRISSVQELIAKKNKEKVGQAKPKSMTQSKSDKKQAFTSHQENSRDYESNICSNFERLCAEINQDPNLKATICHVKHKSLQQDYVDSLNSCWKKAQLQDSVLDSNGNYRTTFKQGGSVEMDMLFVVELSDASKSLQTPPTEVTKNFMGQYLVTIPVPSINLAEVCLDNSQIAIAKKIEQIARHSLLISVYPEFCFDHKFEIDLRARKAQHIYANYPQNLLLVTNNDIVSGLKNFLNEYYRFSQNIKFAEFMKLSTCQPKIATILPNRKDIEELLMKQAQNDVRIGHIGVNSIYSQNFVQLETRIDRLEERQEKTLKQVQSSIDTLNVRLEANTKEIREVQERFTISQAEFQKTLSDNQKALEKTVSEGQKAFEKNVSENQKALEDSIFELRKLIYSLLPKSTEPVQEAQQSFVVSQSEVQNQSHATLGLTQNNDEKVPEQAETKPHQD